jgi:hypothetical protein
MALMIPCSLLRLSHKSKRTLTKSKLSARLVSLFCCRMIRRIKNIFLNKRVIQVAIFVLIVLSLVNFSVRVEAYDSVDKVADIATALPDKYFYIIFGFSLLAGFLFWIPFLIFIGKSILDPQSRFVEIVYDHFAVSIGLPLAAIGSFFTVLVFRATTGPIEFSFAGFQFKGASGPITLWMLCLLAFAFAIRLLWPLSGKQISQTKKDDVNAESHSDENS